MESKRFDGVLAELSTAMARVSAEDVDHEIERWLGTICQVLDLDRSAIYQRAAPTAPVYTTHTWVRPGIPPFPSDYQPSVYLRVTAPWVMAGNALIFSDPKEMPPELEDAAKFVAQFGPRASAVIPMRAGEAVVGAASFGRFRSSREWPPDLVQRLTLVVQMFASAIERKHADNKAQAAQAELRRVSRRIVVGELAAAIAREANQPLAAIMGNLEGARRLASRKDSDSARVIAALDNAISDVKSAAAVLRRVHSLLKTQDRARATVDPSALVEEVAALADDEASRRGISLKVAVANRLPKIKGDEAQLRQCLLNLLANAFDAIDRSQPERREVAVRADLHKPGWVSIKVIDPGVGFEPVNVEKLFAPFSVAVGEDTGLLVARSIIESHGGRIWAGSEPTGGTVFSFILPAIAGGRSKESKRLR